MRHARTHKLQLSGPSVHFLYGDVVYYTVLFLLKHPLYFPILFGGQHSEGHSALTRWTIIAQAKQNRYRSNWSKLLVQGTQGHSFDKYFKYF